VEEQEPTIKPVPVKPEELGIEEAHTEGETDPEVGKDEARRREVIIRYRKRPKRGPTKNLTGTFVGVAAGLMFIYTGLNGTTEWEKTDSILHSFLGEHILLDLLDAAMSYVAYMGGVAIMVGAVLLLGRLHKIGAFLISVGAGFQIMDVFMNLYQDISTDTFSAMNYASVQMMAISLSIYTRWLYQIERDVRKLSEKKREQRDEAEEEESRKWHEEQERLEFEEAQRFEMELAIKAGDQVGRELAVIMPIPGHQVVEAASPEEAGNVPQTEEEPLSLLAVPLPENSQIPSLPIDQAVANIPVVLPNPTIEPVPPPAPVKRPVKKVAPKQPKVARPATKVSRAPPEDER